MANKIIVAVHGMGEQVRQETIQAAARQFCRHCGVPRAIPLGQFHLSANAAPVEFAAPPDPPMIGPDAVGFVEAYWADIPRKVFADGFTLEATRSWGKTVAERIKLRAATVRERRAKPSLDKELRERGSVSAMEKQTLKQKHEEALGPSKVDLNALQIEAPLLVEAIGVVDTALRLLNKAHLIPFIDVKPVLSEYLGDVELVTEYPFYRAAIIEQVCKVFSSVHDVHPEAEIYIVAHSEGTVVTFLSLLQAMSDPAKPTWIKQVHGLMTFGSPIDKHLLVWPELWSRFQSNFDDRNPIPQRIHWRNYYDVADPVGFELDTARDWLNQTGWNSHFNFQKSDDIPSERYLLPGAAHLEYWKDAKVFDDFIEQVIKRTPPQPVGSGQRLKERLQIWGARLMSFSPYLVAAAILVFGVYAFFKGVLEAIDKHAALNGLASAIATTSGVLAGLTLAMQMPHCPKCINRFSLSCGTCWRRGLWTLAMGIILITPFFMLPPIIGTTLDAPPNDAARFVGPDDLPPALWTGLSFGAAVVCATAVTTAAMVLGWTRIPAKLARNFPLAAIGVIGVTVWIARFRIDSHKDQTVFWPMLLGAAALIYCLYLAVLFFNFIVVWRYYVRGSTVMKLLRHDLDPF